jgi:hypothetical protein
MPTIDTTKISGFDTMTDAEKIAALTAFEIPEDVDLSGYVRKTVFDKTASDLAAANKALKGKMTEDEAKQAEAAEKAAADQAEREKLSAELEAAHKEIARMTYVNSYLAIGFEKKLAEETAAAMVAGNMAKVIENSQKYGEAQKAALKAELMNSDPKPGYGGTGTGGEDQETAFGKAAAARMGGGADTLNKTLDYYS